MFLVAQGGIRNTMELHEIQCWDPSSGRWQVLGGTVFQVSGSTGQNIPESDSTVVSPMPVAIANIECAKRIALHVRTGAA